MTRREYSVQLTVNGRKVSKVIIDPHYELKHSRSVNDEVILELVKQLADKTFEPETEAGDFQYFVSDDLTIGPRQFRLVWLLEKNEIYIGVVNAYRRKK
jgi:hypothetical protein